MSIVSPVIRRRNGFTIVELLIVIVVIATLAAITVVAYNGIQARAFDSRRASDVSSIQKAVALYLAEQGTFPNTGGSTTIDALWSTTADASWSTFVTNLSSYAKSIPKDPVSTPNQMFTIEQTYNYSVLHTTASWACSGRDVFIITWRYAQAPRTKVIPPVCTDPTWGPTVSVVMVTAN